MPSAQERIALSLVLPPNGRPPSQFITGAGDSVTAVTAELGGVCSPPPTASAGLRAGDLVMTLTSTVQNRPCPALVALNVYSISVHRVPTGTRTARVEWRLISGDKVSGSVLISRTISPP